MNVFLSAIALIFERFFDWSHFRRWYNFTIYLQWIQKQAFSDWVKLLLWILPLPCLVVLGLYLISPILYSVPAQVLKLCIFMYCLGPQNLWVDGMRARAALQQSDPLLAEVWHKTFNVPASELSKVQGQPESSVILLMQYFVRASFARIFAPLFWFMLFGIGAAVLYRVVDLTLQFVRQSQFNVHYQNTLTLILQIIDSIPLRLMALLFTVFSFKKTFVVFREKLFMPLQDQHRILTDVAISSVMAHGGPVFFAEDSSLQLMRRKLDFVLASGWCVFAGLVWLI